MRHTATGTELRLIPVPFNVSPPGFRFYRRLFSFDARGNALGATTSNSLNGRIGGQ